MSTSIRMGESSDASWWRRAVVYQIYGRSSASPRSRTSPGTRCRTRWWSARTVRTAGVTAVACRCRGRVAGRAMGSRPMAWTSPGFRNASSAGRWHSRGSMPVRTSSRSAGSLDPSAGSTSAPTRSRCRRARSWLPAPRPMRARSPRTSRSGSRSADSLDVTPRIRRHTEYKRCDVE